MGDGGGVGEFGWEMVVGLKMVMTMDFFKSKNYSKINLKKFKSKNKNK